MSKVNTINKHEKNIKNRVNNFMLLLSAFLEHEIELAEKEGREIFDPKKYKVKKRRAR